MSTLAAVMKESLAKANPHTRAVFGAKPLTPRQVSALVRSQTTVVLATVKPSGRPHLSLTGMVSLNGKFYLGESKAYAALRNLQANPRVAVVASGGGWGRHVLMEAEARLLRPRDPRVKAIQEEEIKRFGWSYPVHVEVVPTKVFTWAGS